VGYTWGPKWETSIIEFIEERRLLCFAWKWLDGGPTKCLSIQETRTEKALLLEIHKLLDEAEIVVGQNSDAFDLRVLNARFIHHGLMPPSPYHTIDTFKVAKARFNLNSYKLDDIAKHLNEGEKIKHRGFDMWKGCMANNPADWRDMKKYNKGDVDLLERIFLRLRPWIKAFPPTDHGIACRCGSQKLTKRGFYPTRAARFQRYQCDDCGAWCRDPKGVPRTFRVPI
jgi:hypothetical protein